MEKIYCRNIVDMELLNSTISTGLLDDDKHLSASPRESGQFRRSVEAGIDRGVPKNFGTFCVSVVPHRDLWFSRIDGLSRCLSSVCRSQQSFGSLPSPLDGESEFPARAQLAQLFGQPSLVKKERGIEAVKQPTVSQMPTQPRRSCGWSRFTRREGLSSTSVAVLGAGARPSQRSHICCGLGCTAPCDATGLHLVCQLPIWL